MLRSSLVNKKSFLTNRAASPLPLQYIYIAVQTRITKHQAPSFARCHINGSVSSTSHYFSGSVSVYTCHTLLSLSFLTSISCCFFILIYRSAFLSHLSRSLVQYLSLYPPIYLLRPVFLSISIFFIIFSYFFALLFFISLDLPNLSPSQATNILSLSSLAKFAHSLTLSRRFALLASFFLIPSLYLSFSFYLSFLPLREEYTCTSSNPNCDWCQRYIKKLIETVFQQQISN